MINRLDEWLEKESIHLKTAEFDCDIMRQSRLKVLPILANFF